MVFILFHQKSLSSNTVNTVSYFYNTDTVTTVRYFYNTDTVNTVRYFYNTDTVSTVRYFYNTDNISILLPGKKDCGIYESEWRETKSTEKANPLFTERGQYLLIG